jgi:hypothetical protein
LHQKLSLLFFNSLINFSSKDERTGQVCVGGGGSDVGGSEEGDEKKSSLNYITIIFK